MTGQIFNELPIDPEWARRADEVSKYAAKELKCMVVMIAIQPDGKLGISLDGVPETGELAEIAKDVPRMLGWLAVVANIQDMVGMMGPKQ